MSSRDVNAFGSLDRKTQLSCPATRCVVAETWNRGLGRPWGHFVIRRTSQGKPASAEAVVHSYKLFSHDASGCVLSCALSCPTAAS